MRHAQHFKSHHEFSYGRGAQKRRIEVRVEVPFMMRLAVRGRLMKAHRIRKWNIENLVVGGRHLLQNLRQQDDFFAVEFGKRPQVATAANQDFERPDRPEGHQGDETLVLADQAHFLLLFQMDVVTQQTGLMIVGDSLSGRASSFPGISGIELVAQIWQ